MMHPHYKRYCGAARMTADRSAMVAFQAIGLGDEIGDDSFVRAAMALSDAARVAADLEEQRRLQRASRSGDDENEFDTVADAAVHQLHDDMVGALKYQAAIKSPLLKPLKRFAERHFATGVGHITAARYETQLHRMERLVDDARGPSAALVEALGWENKVVAIEASIEPYRQALAARERVTGGDVRAAQDEMHVALCKLLGYTLWAYADRPELRERMLAPVDDQQDRIAAIMRARRNGRASPVDEAAVADEAEALEGPVEAPSLAEQAQAADGVDAAEAEQGQPDAGERTPAGSGSGSTDTRQPLPRT